VKDDFVAKLAKRACRRAGDGVIEAPESG